MAVMERELRLVPAVRRTTRRWDRTGSVLSIFLVGLALYLAYMLIATLVTWGQVKLDDIRYGYPRTYQTDAFIGYNEQTGVPTHFVVVNAHRQVLIMILPGGDPGHAEVIKGPYLFGPGQEFSPATLQISDLNHDGFPDLTLQVAGQTIVYLNDPRHHTFVLAKGQGEVGR
jgi:hypothetical protein